MNKAEQRKEWKKYFDLFNLRAYEELRDLHFIDFELDHPEVIKETWAKMKQYWWEIKEECGIYPLVSFELHKMDMED